MCVFACVCVCVCVCDRLDMRLRQMCELESRALSCTLTNSCAHSLSSSVVARVAAGGDYLSLLLLEPSSHHLKNLNSTMIAF